MNSLSANVTMVLLEVVKLVKWYKCPNKTVNKSASRMAINVLMTVEALYARILMDA